MIDKRRLRYEGAMVPDNADVGVLGLGNGTGVTTRVLAINNTAEVEGNVTYAAIDLGSYPDNSAVVSYSKLVVMYPDSWSADQAIRAFGTAYPTVVETATVAYLSKGRDDVLRPEAILQDEMLPTLLDELVQLLPANNALRIAWELNSSELSVPDLPY